MTRSNIVDLLERFHDKYNQKGFIENDPIAIPHRFSKKQDIEISGFLAAIFAWGQRITIINKTNAFLELMDNDPHRFILHHQPQDLKAFEDFKHRTFNGTDALYFIAILNTLYSKYDSLEEAFVFSNSKSMKENLVYFNEQFFSLEYAPKRTRKHVASPLKNSTCKRLNMFLRWMVRKDKNGVDLGIWNKIKSHQLMCPLDVHVEKSARKLGLIKRKQRDWKTVEELTNNLKKLDKQDPIKYDFALFGMGLENFEQ